jgi:hypothetical protein
VSETTCSWCGWDPRASDRIHVCTAHHDGLPAGARVAGPARGGGEVFGVVLETRNGPSGVSALVKWQGRFSGDWVAPSRLRLVQDEAA